MSVPALMDSGSACCLMDMSLLFKLPALRKVTVKSLPFECVSANSQTVEVVGSFVYKIRIHNYTWKIPFIVVENLLFPLILGNNFFLSTGLVLDFSVRKYSFKFESDKVWDFISPCDPVSQCPSPPDLCSVNVSGDQEIDSFSLEHLSSEDAGEIRQLVSEFPTVFTDEPGLTTLLEYDICLKDSTPVRLPPYRLSPPKMKILRQHVQTMLDRGIIRPSTSPYSSPIFLVAKGEDEFRPVVDYRALNQKIHVESIPLPDLHSSFHWFTGATVFTSLDLNSAYYQIPLSESSRHLTAFATDWNLYEFCRVPFGIATGAQVLTRLLDKVFSDIKFKYVYTYLDDLVVYSSNMNDHVMHLREVFKRLSEAGLTLKLSKVKFARPHLSFLGHVVSPNGVSIDHSRTQAISDFPVPSGPKAIARFVGMVNFFHKFIPNLAHVAAPLNYLRKKGVKFSWGLEQQKAFEALKGLVANPPVLATADFSKRFVLQTDASSVAVAAVLLQQHPEGRKPIAYASRTLTDQERKFSIYELEALAVLFAVEKFRLYIEHVEFDLETDNLALSWCLARPRKTGRLARWAVRLSAFKYVPHHIRGSDNVVADALSRMFDPAEEPDKVVTAPLVVNFPLAFADLSSHQAQDPQLSQIISKLEAGSPVGKYSFKQGVLYCQSSFDRQPKIVLPQVLVPMIFKYYHESSFGAHLGIYKTRAKIRSEFIWAGMDADIRARVRACHICAMSKPAQNTKVGFLASEVATKPMEKLFIDFIGKLPRSVRGNSYALVVVDAFSKYSWIFPLREATSALAVASLKSLFSSCGPCRYIVSDNGPQFTSKLFRNFCFSMGIDHITTTPYYPKPNHSERFNRNLRAALIAYHHADHSSWDNNLGWLQFAFNTARHESHSATPFSLFYAFTPNSPLSVPSISQFHNPFLYKIKYCILLV